MSYNMVYSFLLYYIMLYYMIYYTYLSGPSMNSEDFNQQICQVPARALCRRCAHHVHWLSFGLRTWVFRRFLDLDETTFGKAADFSWDDKKMFIFPCDLM